MAWPRGLELVDTSTERVFAAHHNQNMMANRGTQVISGLDVAQQTVPDMTVKISAGTLIANGVFFNKTGATASVDLTSFIPTVGGETTKVFIIMDSAGTVTTSQGSDAADGQEVPPLTPEDKVVLAMVTIQDTQVNIQTADIQDWIIEAPEIVYANTTFLIANDADYKALNSSSVEKSILTLNGSNNLIINEEPAGYASIYSGASEHTRFAASGALTLYGSTKDIGISGDLDLIGLAANAVSIRGSLTLGSGPQEFGPSDDSDLLTMSANLLTVAGALTITSGALTLGSGSITLTSGDVIISSGTKKISMPSAAARTLWDWATNYNMYSVGGFLHFRNVSDSKFSFDFATGNLALDGTVDGINISSRDANLSTAETDINNIEAAIRAIVVPASPIGHGGTPQSTFYDAQADTGQTAASYLLPHLKGRTINTVSLKMKNVDGATRTYTLKIQEYTGGSGGATTTGSGSSFSNNQTKDITITTNITPSDGDHLLCYVISSADNSDYDAYVFTITYVDP